LEPGWNAQEKRVFHAKNTHKTGPLWGPCRTIEEEPESEEEPKIETKNEEKAKKVKKKKPKKSQKTEPKEEEEEPSNIDLDSIAGVLGIK